MYAIDSMNSLMSKAQKFLFINCICRLYAAVMFVAVWCNGTWEIASIRIKKTLDMDD